MQHLFINNNLCTLGFYIKSYIVHLMFIYVCYRGTVEYLNDTAHLIYINYLLPQLVEKLLGEL